MALILNIETSTSVCSVALSENGKNIAHKITDEPNSHSKILTVFIENIFKESKINIKEIDAVSVSRGPGSYTGLRIGVSVAKGIAYGISKPLISVNTLRLMVKAVKESDNKFRLNEKTFFAPMIDARRMEVYTAIFNNNCEMITDINADIIEENYFNDVNPENKILYFGNGASKCVSIINRPDAVFIENIYPDAKYMAEISEENYNASIFENTAYFEPFYLKNFIATVPKKNIFY